MSFEICSVVQAYLGFGVILIGLCSLGLLAWTTTLGSPLFLLSVASLCPHSHPRELMNVQHTCCSAHPSRTLGIPPVCLSNCAHLFILLLFLFSPNIYKKRSGFFFFSSSSLTFTRFSVDICRVSEWMDRFWHKALFMDLKDIVWNRAGRWILFRNIHCNRGEKRWELQLQHGNGTQRRTFLPESWGRRAGGTQAVNRCCQGLKELSSGKQTFETDHGILWTLSWGPQGATPCALIKIRPNCELTALVCKKSFKGCTME